MISILGENYYLDFEKIDMFISVPSATGETEQSISIAKYEMIKTMIEVLMTEQDDLDENLGAHQAKNLSIPFKLAFNTLLVHNILKSL